MRVLITGSSGFIGKNLALRLSELGRFDLMHFNRGDSIDQLHEMISHADAIVHLAGANRPLDIAEFSLDNTALTQNICTALMAKASRTMFVLASSIQASLPNPYGQSKMAAECAVEKLTNESSHSTVIYRLPNVFGKWCRPNYNSVVATFCHNIAIGVPIQVDDATKDLSLVYVDDVATDIIEALDTVDAGLHRRNISPVYSTTLGQLAAQLQAFHRSRTNLVSERVGTGLVRALYATYISYLPPPAFTYALPCHRDQRGVFVEMLKTPDCGQFSYFTAHPGVTRGSHYHHTKTEKFLVVKGQARFGFRNVISNETCEIHASGESPQVVESIPGWSHDITNVGSDEMTVMLWANEIFDRALPDTIACKV